MELADLERRGWEALCTAGAGGPFYEEVLDEEPVMLLPGGMLVTDRAAIVEAMSGPPWSSFSLEDVAVHLLGDDVAVVTYGVVAQRGEEPPYSALMASTYVRRPAGWRLAVHQQTPR